MSFDIKQDKQITFNCDKRCRHRRRRWPCGKCEKPKEMFDWYQARYNRYVCFVRRAGRQAGWLNCKRIRIRIRAYPNTSAKISSEDWRKHGAAAAAVVVVKWQTFARTSQGKRPARVCSVSCVRLCVHNKHHMRSTPRRGRRRRETATMIAG